MLPERSARPFPWDDAMCFGMGVLRLAPTDFWAMTPRELAAAMGVWAGPTQSPPARRALDGMLAAFPDRQDNDHG